MTFKPGVWWRSQKRRGDAWLSGKMSPRAKALFYHYLRQTGENILAVVPISLLLITSMAAFFQVAPADPITMVVGLMFAIIGLLLFVDGLRILVMPLGELIGEELPTKYSMPVVLAVAGVLGVLVTFAEPAVASLKPLADLVDRQRAPYLFYILNQQQFVMKLCIGAGVGLAAVVGTLRFVNNWSLKPLIALTVIPTLVMSIVLAITMPGLVPVLGLAWDCGAVTTGPVTVPILLALGIGVMKSQKQKQLAKAALDQEVEAGSGNALEGFGIVTLASIFPILMMLLLGLAVGLRFSEEEILEEVMNYVPASGGLTSPVKEIAGAFQSILPLVAVLLLIVFLLLRRGLPAITVWVPYEEEAPDDEGDEDEDVLAAAVEETGKQATRKPHLRRFKSRKAAEAEAQAPVLEEGKAMNYSFIAGGPGFKSFKMSYDDDEEEDMDADGEPRSLHKLGEDAEAAAHAADAGYEYEGGAMAPRAPQGTKARTYITAGIGYLLAQGGMILFQLGLTYGFTALGNQAGTLFPAAFLAIEGIPRSPYYPAAIGIIIVLALVFCLGFLATRAEPALNVLGRTVQHLSNGEFSCSLLVYAVSVGVGTGMLVGACKVLFGLPLVYILLVKYSIALTETIFASEDYTNIAWDSAGVTTGPVTVPFVLALGIGFSTATHAAEGFGILTAASVAPIISVLALSIIRSLMAKRRGPSYNTDHGASLSPSTLGKSAESLNDYETIELTQA